MYRIRRSLDRAADCLLASTLQRARTRTMILMSRYIAMINLFGICGKSIWKDPAVM